MNLSKLLIFILLFFILVNALATPSVGEKLTLRVIELIEEEYYNHGKRDIITSINEYSITRTVVKTEILGSYKKIYIQFFKEDFNGLKLIIWDKYIVIPIKEELLGVITIER